MGVLGALFRTAGRPGKERTLYDCAPSRDAPPVTGLKGGAGPPGHTPSRPGWRDYRLVFISAVIMSSVVVMILALA
jgi:hypothetical protein